MYVHEYIRLNCRIETARATQGGRDKGRTDGKGHVQRQPSYLSVKGVELCGKRHALICPRSSFVISPSS